MREEFKSASLKPEDQLMAELAADMADSGIDSYSEYGVGAAVAVSLHTEEILADDYEDDHFATDRVDLKGTHHETLVYGGFNINISGMEVKIHAEQMALFQAILDISQYNLESMAVLQSVMVVTTENDLALKCGHCLQTILGACNHFSWDEREVEYSAAKAQSTHDGRGNPEGVLWFYDKYKLDELMSDTYVRK